MSCMTSSGESILQSPARMCALRRMIFGAVIEINWTVIEIELYAVQYFLRDLQPTPKRFAFDHGRTSGEFNSIGSKLPLDD